MKYVRFTLRLLSLPFVMGMSLIHSIFLWVKFNVCFLLYGGEVITYTQKTRPKSILDTYNKVVDLIHQQESNGQQ